MANTKYWSFFLVVNFFTAAFLCWVLQFVHQTVRVLWRTQQFLPAAHSEDVLFPCIFGRFEAMHFLMGCSLASIAFYLSGALFSIALSVLILANCRNGKMIIATGLLYDVLLRIGYLLLLVTHFERLRQTFSGTWLRLPKWAPNVLYAALTVGVLLTTLDYVVWLTEPPSFLDPNAVSNRVAFDVLFAAWILLDFLTVTTLIRSFYQKTLLIASNDDLVEMAVRISLSVSASLICSFLVFLSYVVVAVICSKCILFHAIRVAIFRLSVCLNAFCLMCTFARAKPRYLQVFGRAHGIFLRRVLSQRKLATRSVGFVPVALEPNNTIKLNASVN